jgi:hypothetical protein
MRPDQADVGFCSEFKLGVMGHGGYTLRPMANDAGSTNTVLSFPRKAELRNAAIRE